MQIVREIKQRRVQFGGDQHSGWLPSGASTPLPTPEHTVLVDFTIFDDGPGSFILEWTCKSNGTSGDTWHPDLTAALEQAEEWFGILPEEWQIANDTSDYI